MRTKTAVLTATLLCAATLPLAANASGLTIGGNVGSARVNEGDFQGNDTGWKVSIGSSYREIIGGELAFVNFGRLGGGDNGPDAQAWAPALTLGMPIGMARLYAKGGMAFAEEKHSSLREDSKNNDPFYGAGLGIGITPHLGFRAEYERYKLFREKVDMASAGLEFRF